MYVAYVVLLLVCCVPRLLFFSKLFLFPFIDSNVVFNLSPSFVVRSEPYVCRFLRLVSKYLSLSVRARSDIKKV